MEQVPGKAVDDAEAEAALLALGSNLKWRVEIDDQYGFCSTAHLVADLPCFYMVDRPTIYISGSTDIEGQVRWRAVFVNDEGEHEVGALHNTYEAAKAACERHHATGKRE